MYLVPLFSFCTAPTTKNLRALQIHRLILCKSLLCGWFHGSLGCVNWKKTTTPGNWVTMIKLTMGKRVLQIPPSCAFMNLNNYLQSPCNTLKSPFLCSHLSPNYPTHSFNALVLYFLSCLIRALLIAQRFLVGKASGKHIGLEQEGRRGKNIHIY